MPKDNGLKRIYRFSGIGVSYTLFKISKNINPNTITITGFLVFISGWTQYLMMYLFSEIIFINKIFLIVAINIALILDKSDGEYARRVNKSTIKGEFLDGILDIIKISLTYFIIYFTSNDQIIKLMLFLSSVIFALSVWIRYSMWGRHGSDIENSINTPSKEGRFLTISLLFGFSIVHQYLYFSIFLIFGVWQILLLQLLFGLGMTFYYSMKLMKMARDLDKNSQFILKLRSR